MSLFAEFLKCMDIFEDTCFHSIVKCADICAHFSFRCICKKYNQNFWQSAQTAASAHAFLDHCNPAPKMKNQRRSRTSTLSLLRAGMLNADVDSEFTFNTAYDTANSLDVFVFSFKTVNHTYYCLKIQDTSNFFEIPSEPLTLTCLATFPHYKVCVTFL